MSQEKIAFEKWKLENLRIDSKQYYRDVSLGESAWQAATAEANKRMAELEGELADTRNAYHASRTEFYAMQASNKDLREALGWIDRVNACDYEYQRISREALSTTPAESLQAFENEVLERAAKKFDDRNFHNIGKSIRALKGK